MIRVIDASVALKWFLRESPGETLADEAAALLEQAADGRIRMVQPPHFIAEVAAVLARLKPDAARDDIADLLQVEHETFADEAVYSTALQLAVRHRQHMFDTLYHALALNLEDAVYVTADQRYFDKVRGEGRIVMLR